MGRIPTPEVPDPVYKADTAGEEYHADCLAAVVPQQLPAKAKGHPLTSRRAVDGAAYKGTQRHLGREALPHVD